MRSALVCILVFLALGEALIRTWLPNTNVLNEDNWIHDGNECRGIQFPQNLGGLMSLSSANTKYIELPLNGEIAINDEASIILDEDDIGCVKVKPIEFKDWFDPRNWNVLQNKAIPDIERIPCRLDDVVFDQNASFAITTSIAEIRVNSVTFMGHKMAKDKWAAYLNSDEGSNMFKQVPLTIETKICGGHHDLCTCHKSTKVAKYNTCRNVKFYKKDTEMCKDPIKPQGQCTSVCGAYIHTNVAANLSKIKNFLSQFEDKLQYHYSRIVLDNNKPALQFVLVDDDDSTGGYYSTEAAQLLDSEFKQNLKKYGTTEVNVITSGRPIRTREVINITLGIVFGALLVTLVFFVAIYVVYVGPMRDYKIDLRSIRLQRTFQPFVFARFDNNDEGNISFDRSIQSSVASLVERAFDNPMYGQELPSTSNNEDYEKPQDASPEDAVEAAAMLQQDSRGECRGMEIQEIH